MGSSRLSNSAIAVVFARGSDDRVPLLNARFLSGKPLLNYTVEAALNSRYVSKVYVSTEDPRIANVAREAGAEVLHRPEKLSRSNTPIYQAMEHAAAELAEPLAEAGNTLLCMPADAVFCGSGQLDIAIERYFDGQYDQVIGLLPENKMYVIWGESEDNKIYPVVEPPDLRISKDSLLAEPGVLTVWRIVNGILPRRSSNVGYVTLDERSAIRVNTDYDMWLAERLIAPNHLALRCDGSRSMGMGHVMRMIYVAEQFIEPKQSHWKVRFFVGSDCLEGAGLLTERGFDVDIVDQRDYSHWVRRIEQFSPSVVINDLPFVPADYTDSLRSIRAKSLTLVDSVADIEPGNGLLDAVISHMDETFDGSYGSYHHGLQYAPFHPSVTSKLLAGHKKKINDGRLTVLVAFGTGDPGRLTPLALDALSKCAHDWRRVLVAVPSDQQDDEFDRLVDHFKCPVDIIRPFGGLGDLLDRSDLALVSGGVSALEASALGVPAIVLCQNQRDLIRMQNFERIGSILLLGLGSQVVEDQFFRGLDRLAGDPALRSRMSWSGSNATDGRGIERIAQMVGELIQP